MKKGDSAVAKCDIIAHRLRPCCVSKQTCHPAHGTPPNLQTHVIIRAGERGRRRRGQPGHPRTGHGQGERGGPAEQGAAARDRATAGDGDRQGAMSVTVLFPDWSSRKRVLLELIDPCVLLELIDPSF